MEFLSSESEYLCNDALRIAKTPVNGGTRVIETEDGPRKIRLNDPVKVRQRQKNLHLVNIQLLQEHLQYMTDEEKKERADRTIAHLKDRLVGV